MNPIKIILFSIILVFSNIAMGQSGEPIIIQTDVEITRTPDSKLPPLNYYTVGIDFNQTSGCSRPGDKYYFPFANYDELTVSKVGIFQEACIPISDFKYTLPESCNVTLKRGDTLLLRGNINLGTTTIGQDLKCEVTRKQPN